MSTAGLNPPDDQRAALQAAFRVFGSVSEQLSGAFDALRGQVARLQEDLRAAHAGNEHLSARMSALVNGLPGGALLLDGQGTILENNPAALDLLSGPLTGHAFADVLSRATVSNAAPSEHTELRHGRFVSISRREIAGGGAVVLLTDVTEAHLMQVFLNRQQRLLTLGELAAGLAHQIRTPLATALLYASQMTLPDRTEMDLRRCGGLTVESLRQLDRLVNDMLAFAQGGAARESVSVSAVLEQVAQWLRPALQRGICLTIRTEAPDLKIRANAPSLVSAILNLATNAMQAAAVQATAQSGVGQTPALNLELLARRSADGGAEIVVSDDGPGISPSVRERIFEPFFTTRSRGNGIGLSIVKSVIEAHGGRVYLAESAIGATFIMNLPTGETA